MITRRRALLGMLAAPVIVRASSLMAVVPAPAFERPAWVGLALGDLITFDFRTGVWRIIHVTDAAA